MDEFKSAIIAATISLCGVVLSAVVSFIIGFGTNRYNYNKMFTETVSDRRMEWINIWRENISKFLACAETLHNKNVNSEKSIEIYKEMLEARNMVISRLNNEEELHALMNKALMNFDYSAENFYEQRDYVLKLVRNILKPEWERVKNEAKGKNNK